MANEFDSMSEDEFPSTPAVTESTNESMLSNVRQEEYDFSKASDKAKYPPRVNLGGKTLKLLDAKIILPDSKQPWMPTRKKDKETKTCQFIMFYDHEGQVEFLSGVRVFKQTDGKYSNPSITRDRQNQASELLGLYADYKKKNINEISMKEFGMFLKSKPMVEIISREVKNPTTGVTINKNLIKRFI